MLPHLVVRPEHDRLGFDWQIGLSDRPSLTDDPDPGDVLRLLHDDQITGRPAYS